MVNEIEDFIYSAPRTGAPQLVRANYITILYRYSIIILSLFYRYNIDTLSILYRYASAILYDT